MKAKELMMLQPLMALTEYLRRLLEDVENKMPPYFNP